MRFVRRPQYKPSGGASWARGVLPGVTVPSILVVDPDPASRTMFTRALRALGDVLHTSCVSEALDIASARKFDFLLLSSPVDDSRSASAVPDLLHGPNRATPICVVSSDVIDGERVRAVRAHGSFFLMKPVRLGALIALVSDALRRSLAACGVPR
jgi:CheY-like chemotaxis protein